MVLAMAAEVTTWLSGHAQRTIQRSIRAGAPIRKLFSTFFHAGDQGRDPGSKKHYCGSIENEGEIKLVFKGMESARSDWTELAKELQHELLLRLFAKRDVEDYIVDIVKRLKAGEFDSKLVYKKRLRKSLDEYTTTVPQHVQAARLLPSPRHIIRYFITHDGPQPVENMSSPIDYNHYIECQLKPVCIRFLNGLVRVLIRFSGRQDLFG